MTPWEARDFLLERDPKRALRCEQVDPLPPPPKPCTCADEDKVEVTSFGSLKPIHLCIGRCT